MLPMLSNETTFPIQRLMVLFYVLFGKVIETILCAVCELAKHACRNLVILIITMILSGVYICV